MLSVKLRSQSGPSSILLRNPHIHVVSSPSSSLLLTTNIHRSKKPTDNDERTGQEQFIPPPPAPTYTQSY